MRILAGGRWVLHAGFWRGRSTQDARWEIILAWRRFANRHESSDIGSPGTSSSGSRSGTSGPPPGLTRHFSCEYAPLREPPCAGGLCCGSRRYRMVDPCADMVTSAPGASTFAIRKVRVQATHGRRHGTCSHARCRPTEIIRGSRRFCGDIPRRWFRRAAATTATRVARCANNRQSADKIHELFEASACTYDPLRVRLCPFSLR
jgi:hypothetical protein